MIPEMNNLKKDMAKLQNILKQITIPSSLKSIDQIGLNSQVKISRI